MGYKPKIGDCFLTVGTERKIVIAKYLGYREEEYLHDGIYKFTYSHWNFNGSNLISQKMLDKDFKFSKSATILYGDGSK